MDQDAVTRRVYTVPDVPALALRRVLLNRWQAWGYFLLQLALLPSFTLAAGLNLSLAYLSLLVVTPLTLVLLAIRCRGRRFAATLAFLGGSLAALQAFYALYLVTLVLVASPIPTFGGLVTLVGVVFAALHVAVTLLAFETHAALEHLAVRPQSGQPRLHLAGRPHLSRRRGARAALDERNAPPTAWHSVRRWSTFTGRSTRHYNPSRPRGLVVSAAASTLLDGSRSLHAATSHR